MNQANFVQGGVISVPALMFLSKELAQKAIEEAIENEFDITFLDERDVNFEDFEHTLSPMDDTVTSHYNFQLSFECNLAFDVEESEDITTIVDNNVAWTLDGFENHFSVKHAETSDIT